VSRDWKVDVTAAYVAAQDQDGGKIRFVYSEGKIRFVYSEGSYVGVLWVSSLAGHNWLSVGHAASCCI
jgi:hypothetical protein